MKKFLVGLAVGGLMEMPNFQYQNKEIIEAQDEKEAQEIYNKKHNCSYFYAKSLGEIIEKEGKNYILEEI